MSFCEVTGKEYTELLKRRLDGTVEELTWLKQFRKILKAKVKPGMLLLDIGCATGYAYKSFKELGVHYVGIEFEAEYIEIARKVYSGDENVRIIEHDMLRSAPDVRGDVVICSAMIEHCPKLNPVLNNVLEASNNVVMLRTFLGEREDIYAIPSPVKEFEQSHLKHTNQYAFSDVLQAMEKKGFKTKIYQDEYTKSVPQLVDHTVRTFYVVYGEKIRGEA